MAVTRMWDITTRLDQVVDYIINDFKTTDHKPAEEIQYVSYFNCNQFAPYHSMKHTKEVFKDNSKILAFHGYQSFKIGEVDAETAHEIGIKLAKKLWSDRYEVIVSTHLDKKHYHNHILINATSFIDGKRYCNTYNDIHKMRKVSDELCKEYGLSVIENPKHKGKKRESYYSQITYINDIKKDIDSCIKHSLTMTYFYEYMKLKGYSFEIDEDKEPYIIHPYYHKPIYLKQLGVDYNEEGIAERIYDVETNTRTPMFLNFQFDVRPYQERYKKQKLTGFQRLYFHYLYLLGILPKKSVPKRYYSREMRKEIKKLDNIIHEMNILCKNNISTDIELLSFQQQKQDRLDELIKLRKNCYYKGQRATGKEEKDEWSKIAKTYTPEIKQLRYDIKSCDEIMIRSLRLKSQIKKMENHKDNINKRKRYYKPIK